MKKTFTFLLLIAPLLIFAQVPKMVLYEGFTQASCGPCASQNPAKNALVAANLDKLVPIKHQTSWPGTDPMNQHNAPEVATRVSYYGITGVPSERLNGQDVAFNQTNINAQYNTNAKFTIDIDAEMDEALEVITATITVTAQENISTTNFKTRIAVVEKEILFDVAPGSNGETRFIYVMKKFLPNAAGLNLPASMTAGESVTFTETWTHANVYEISELAVVAYVQQDNTAKTVYQAGIRNVQIPVEFDLDAALVEAKVLDLGFATNEVCDYKVAPKVKIRNQGNFPLTSLKIEYSVNDGSTKTYNWTGNLETFGRADITLPEVSFFHGATGINTLYVKVLDPNNAIDQVLSNNEVEVTFNQAKNSGSNVNMSFSHDQYGDEITWELKNSAGTVLYSGGPYNNAAGVKTASFTNLQNDCYQFIVYDSFGDAQLGSATGVTLIDVIGGTNLLTNFNGYGSEGRFNFGVNADQSTLVPDSSEVFLSIKNVELVSLFNVYPNPANSIVNVELTTKGVKEMKIELIDVLGRKLAVKETFNGKATFDVMNYNKGIYFINVIDNGVSVATSRVVVTK